MKYEINYNNISDEQRKRDSAINDIKQYMGDRYGILGDYAMRATKYRYLSYACGFAGIEGYPVVALWEETRQEMKDMTT